MTRYIYQHVLEECVKAGVKEFCVCPGSRNSPLINCLVKSPELIKHYWFEERSAAFFALGRARESRAPVAVVTTSGTAAGELLPAAMEAFYTGVPLLLITADRPHRFRGTGAPQTAEQEGLFGVYTRFAQDLEGEETCRIQYWDLSGPAHLNVCIEEPKSYPAIYHDLSPHIPNEISCRSLPKADPEFLNLFFQKSRRPLIIVSALKPEERAAVCDFLCQLNAPIYCEGGSGLREEPRLSHLQVRAEAAVWKSSKANGYEIDGVIRIGGVPVTRLWRDLEERSSDLAQCSLSELPFSGLSWGNHIQCWLPDFLPSFTVPNNWKCTDATAWIQMERKIEAAIYQLLQEFPTSETALYHALSLQIPNNSLVYLGNSLPVREWDLAATIENKGLELQASRGLNGIDGQLSTFLGLCREDRDNWTILGDLTTLYDFPALWILPSMPKIPVKVIVINNGGGKLFARIYKDPIFQHIHDYQLEHFAKSWRIPYLSFDGIVPNTALPHQAFVEIFPDPKATDIFWQKYDELGKI